MSYLRAWSLPAAWTAGVVAGVCGGPWDRTYSHGEPMGRMGRAGPLGLVGHFCQTLQEKETPFHIVHTPVIWCLR